MTQLVQQLEARLRVKLLNRTTRKVNVTADGAAYYERVVRLLADMDDAETSLSSAAAPAAGPPAGGRAQPARATDPGAGLAGVPCALSRDPARHGRKRSHRGPDRRERGLRGARRRAHRSVADGAPRGRSAARGLCGARLSGARRHAGASATSWKVHTTASWVSCGRAGQAVAIRHAARRRARRTCRAATCSRSTTAMPISQPAWPAWACYGFRTTWPERNVARGELVPLFEDWRLDPMPLLPGVPAEPPCQRQAARVHRLDRRADGPPCAHCRAMNHVSMQAGRNGSLERRRKRISLDSTARASVTSAADAPRLSKRPSARARGDAVSPCRWHTGRARYFLGPICRGRRRTK